MPADEARAFRIWGIDDVIYGPVDLPLLVAWVEEDRITRDTWIHDETRDEWQKAGQVPELRGYFDETTVRTKRQATYDTELISKSPDLKPGTLRRVKVFAGLADEQLTRLVKYMELVEAKPFEQLVRFGTPGDAMYLILQGEVRVRMMVEGKESIIATLGSGDFFGEIALFDHGPRSADVITNAESILLRFSAAAFEKVTRSEPELAAPFLLAMGKTLASRIRADNKRFRETVAFARVVG
jgi:CRP/FNR family transcriptional regulator, cyclic AMP receptor protein